MITFRLSNNLLSSPPVVEAYDIHVDDDTTIGRIIRVDDDTRYYLLSSDRTLNFATLDEAKAYAMMVYS